MTGHVAGVHAGVNAQHQELKGISATREMLTDAGRSEASARSALADELRRDSADLRGVCAMREDVDASIDACRREHQVVASQVAKLHTRVAEVTDAHRRLFERQEGVREEFNHDKVMMQRISAQQQQNRIELSSLTQRSSDLEAIGVQVSDMQLTARGERHRVAQLQRDVEQWDLAVTAQQGLRRDAAQLRADLDELRKTVAKLKEEQALSMSDLRALHT